MYLNYTIFVDNFNFRIFAFFVETLHLNKAFLRINFEKDL